MKLTKKQLKEIIKEELNSLNEIEAGEGSKPSDAKAELVKLSQDITAGPINDKERKTILDLAKTLTAMATGGELNQQAILTYLEKAVEAIKDKLKDPPAAAGAEEPQI